MRIEDLDDALKGHPAWEPPPGFAQSVAARAPIRNDPQPAFAHRRVIDLLHAAELAVVSAASAYAGAWMLWRLTPLVMSTVVANAVPVAWTCAVLSLLSAMRLTGDAYRRT